MLLQRTGLTEGSLIFNNWLKSKNLYRQSAEEEFINWLYSTSGWYDTTVSGSYFDFDFNEVVGSPVYQRFLRMFENSLYESKMIHLMVHSSYHVGGQHLKSEYAAKFAPENYCYWKNVPLLKSLIKNKKTLVISSIAPLIADSYDVIPYRTPQTHFNTGPDKNAIETLERVFSELPTDYDIALVAFGAYGCPLAKLIHDSGKDALTIGSGIYELFDVGEIPAEYRPKGYLKIENGRYWKNT